MLGLLLSHGAAITSLGLAIATWVSRPGRAVALSVAVYVLIAIGWPIAVLVLLSGGSDHARILVLMGAPPFGAGIMSVVAADPGHGFGGGMTVAKLVFGALLWIGINAGAAVFLNWITFSTFDDRLGRIPDAGLPRARPIGLSSLSAAELLELVPSSPEDEP